MPNFFPIETVFIYTLHSSLEQCSEIKGFVLPEISPCLIYSPSPVLWIYFLTDFSGENFFDKSLTDKISDVDLGLRKPYVKQNIFICKSLHTIHIIFSIYLPRFGMTVSKWVNIFMALTFVLIVILPRLWECQYSSSLCNDLLQHGLYNLS